MEQKTEKSEKEPFYGELDRRAGRSCFNFTTLFVFLLVVLIVGSVGAIWLVRKARELPSHGKKILPSQQAKEAIGKKIEKLIKQSETETTVTFTLTEEELTTLLTETLAKSPVGKRFKEPQVELDPPLIVIHATLVDPLRSQTTWFIEPEVSEGKLTARIVRVEAGKLTIPEAITGQFSPDLNELLSGFLPLAGRFEPTAVEVRRDALVIQGTIR